MNRRIRRGVIRALATIAVVACVAAGAEAGERFRVTSDALGGTVGLAAAGTACGDGIVQAPEECDDGNSVDDDACANDCTLNPCIDSDGDGFGAVGNPSCPGGDAEDCDDGDITVYPGAAETCNDVDDDCDGATDEPFFVGSACLPAGECGLGVFECDAEGGAVCSTGPGGSDDESRAELCDGADNDCDGATDEGFDVGASCEGLGVCGAGVLECDGSGAAICSTESGGSADSSQPEICDDVDNDCDGEVDEGFDVGGDCGLGACEGGIRECTVDGSATQCSTEAGGSNDQSGPEVCDGIDNDCNGSPDVLGFDGSETDDDGDGQSECDGDCDDADPDNFAGNAETCDGQDNDCDASVDNGFDVGLACAGEGECGPGVFECDDAGSAVCSTDPGGSADASAPETCDTLDNDCDGEADEGYDIGQACTGVGECGAGVVECGPAGEAVCSTDPGASADGSLAESCDSLDNDCDGEIDEGFILGDACGEGACSGGIIECSSDGAGVQCSTEAGGSADASGPDVCDGLDNDCDGEADEDFSLGVACDGAGECGAGVVECDGSGGAVCSSGAGGTADESTPETCDGLDNDCDGSTDEDFNVGEGCLGVGECGAGVFECDNAGVAICSSDPGGSADASTPEVCDSLDNDCDGLMDEEFSLGEACGAGECAGGVLECLADETGTQCSTEPGGTADATTPELCDGLDNDCDGEVDEEFDIGESCGIGACAGGVKECTESGSATTCATMPGGSQDASSPEVCDGLDNDCNGLDDVLGFDGSETDDDGDGVSECDADCDDADAQVFTGNTELCDGLDNDCDDLIDEGDPEVGVSCGTTDEGACSLGVGVCDAGVFRCVGKIDPTPEVCDEVDNDCDGETDEGDPHEFLLDEGFAGPDSIFPPWLGTGPDSSLTGPNRFEVLEDDGDPALATTSTSLNLHAHYATFASAGWSDYVYTGRMKLTDPSGGIGVTALSDYPNSDHYYRLRRIPQDPNFKISAHGTTVVCDSDDSGVNPRDGAWYLFELQVEADEAETRIRAKVWRDGDPAPAGWQLSCSDSSATRRSTGTVGAWSMGQGTKLWDDLSARLPEGTDTLCGSSDEGECSFGTRECLAGSLVCSGGVFPEEETCDGLDNDCDGEADESRWLPGEELWRSGFDEVGNPPDWVDTGADNSLFAEDNFQVFDLDGDFVFGTTTTATNIHSHYTGSDSAEWSNYVYRGRLRLTDPAGGIGVTVLSAYPDSDHYYRLRRLVTEPNLALNAHGTSLTCDVADTGVDPADGEWYWFEVQVESIFGAVQAKAWRDGSPEPVSWQQQCVDETTTLRTNGTVGVWSMAGGSKYWDDLVVTSNGDTLGGAGHCGVTDVGACQFGLQQCEEGQLVCLGQVDPVDEVCDGLDNDCDGVVDEPDALDALTWYVDGDGDGFGDVASSIQACDQPEGYVADASDCDDSNGEIFPGNDELCDGIDNDCDATTTEADAVDATTWYPDVDGDGFGDAAQGQRSCDELAGFLTDGTDCDDGDALVFPGQWELCDGIDNDCSGVADEGLTGSGGVCSVGVGACEVVGRYACSGEGPGVCDAVPGDPSTEQCDFVDNDCDGLIDDGPDGEDANNNGCNDACDPVSATVVFDRQVLNKAAQGSFVEALLDLGPTFGAFDIAEGSLFELSVGGSTPIPESGREVDEFGRIRLEFSRASVQDLAALGTVLFTITGETSFGCGVVAQADLLVVDEGRLHVNETDYSSVLGDALRGDLSALGLGPDGDLGTVVCLINFVSDYQLITNTHPGDPAVGEAFFYLQRYCNGTETCSYGTTSAGSERLPSSGGCPGAGAPAAEED